MSTVVTRTVANIGAGSSPLPKDRFPPEEWSEIRVDVDEALKPDVVADMRKLPFDDESLDGILCEHTLEHLPEHDVPVALHEFFRVLKPGGELVVVVPDLMSAAEAVVEGRLGEIMYDSPSGPVRAIDMIYGWAPAVLASELMLHRTGFTHDSLGAWLGYCGFGGEVHRLAGFHVWAEARKPGGCPAGRGTRLLSE